MKHNYMHGVDENAYLIPDEIIEKHIEFEKKVMNFIIDGEGEVFDILREQYSNSKVVKREFTGVGFFTEFEIFGEIEKVVVPKRDFGDVSAIYKDGSNIALYIMFILWIEDGKLDTLEGVTIDEWNYDYDNYIPVMLIKAVTLINITGIFQSYNMMMP